LNPGVVQAFLSGLSADEVKARVHGHFVQVGGLIYKQFGSKHIIDPWRPEPGAALVVATLDHGFNNPTAWLWGAIDREGRVIIFDEHYESGQIVGYHAQRVHEINATHGYPPAYYVGDPSIRNVDPITGTSVQLEYMDYSIPVMPANNDVRGGINRVARLLEGQEGRPSLYITRNCVNLIYEMHRYRWGTWANKRANFDKNKKEEPHKKNDHAVDALRYLIASRPLKDDGTDIPNFSFGELAARAVDPNIPRVDAGVLAPARNGHVDFTLGDDW